MPRNTYKYNLYRIKKQDEQALRDHLENRGLEVVQETVQDNYTTSFYLCSDPDRVDDIWWVKQFASVIPKTRIDEIVNYTYYGAVVLSSAEVCYVIPLGKTHFYLREFAEPDFGVELACRIADEKSVNVVNTRSFGGGKTKSIDTFSDDSALIIESGESLDYLNADLMDKDKWGKKGSFGTSALLNSPLPFDRVNELLDAIEEELQKPGYFEPPRAIVVKSKGLQAELDNELAQALTHNTSENSFVDIGAVSLHGIEFIFKNVQRYKVILPNPRTYSEPTDELDFEFIKNFALNNGCVLSEYWKDVKVQYQDGDGRPRNTERLSNVISFVTVREGKYYFLKDGKWFEFSERYVANLQASISELTLLPHDSTQDLDVIPFTGWSASRPDGAVKYKEYWYNTHVLPTPTNGWVSYDRKFVGVDGYRDYTIEPVDVYDPINERFIFVKRWGETADFAYLIDQAITTIRSLGASNKIEVHGDTLTCRVAELLLVKKGNPVNSLVDLKSLMILQKLNTFQAECRRKSIAPQVRIQYEING